MKVQTKSQKMLLECAECGRVFDLLDEEDVSEFYHGHDCEE